MHEISLIDFSPFVILDDTLRAVPVDKRVAIAERERLKTRDTPPMAEIDGLALKRPIGRIFEKEVYLSDPKFGEAEDRRVVAIGRPHAGNFHLYNYFNPATGRYLLDKALTPATRARQIALIVLMLAITLVLAVLSLGFDDMFTRVWHFYLAYSQAGFASGYINVSQLTLTREDQ